MTLTIGESWTIIGLFSVPLEFHEELIMDHGSTVTLPDS